LRLSGCASPRQLFIVNVQAGCSSKNKRGKQNAALDRVKTFVYVMLENRSFDHMLGYLSLVDPKVSSMAL